MLSPVFRVFTDYHKDHTLVAIDLRDDSLLFDGLPMDSKFEYTGDEFDFCLKMSGIKSKRYAIK